MISVEVNLIYLIVLATVPAFFVYMIMYKALVKRDKDYKKLANENLELNNALLETEAELVKSKNKQTRPSTEKLIAVKTA